MQQALNFRKRIINSVKGKSLQNQKLNGDMYCSMMNSYVNAINEEKLLTIVINSLLNKLKITLNSFQNQKKNSKE